MRGKNCDKKDDWADCGHSLNDQEVLAFLDQEAKEAGFGSDRQKFILRAAEIIRNGNGNGTL